MAAFCVRIHDDKPELDNSKIKVVLHTLSSYYHVRLITSDTSSLNSIITVIEETLDVKIEKGKMY